MPEDGAATATETTAVETQTTTTTDDTTTDDTPLGEKGEKALEAMKTRAREAEKLAKERDTRLKEVEGKLTEREEADKSELEKAQGKLSKAEQDQALAEVKLLRYEVAQEKEVPAKLVPLLTATDKEGLEAQADLILENAKPTEVTDLDGGARKDSAPNVEPGLARMAHAYSNSK